MIIRAYCTHYANFITFIRCQLENPTTFVELGLGNIVIRVLKARAQNFFSPISGSTLDPLEW